MPVDGEMKEFLESAASPQVKLGASKDISKNTSKTLAQMHKDGQSAQNERDKQQEAVQSALDESQTLQDKTKKEQDTALTR